MSEAYEFSKENKGLIDSALDFPRLRLEKKGEKARLAIFGIAENKKGLVVPEPEGGFYFDLRVPGAEREYVGSFECLADEATKAEGKFDPDVCPHCEVALRGDVSEDIMRPRQRKFVLPVVRYATQPGTSTLIEPASVEVLAWRFTDRYFNVLVDEHTKWLDTEGLLGHDITLTCEAVQYQNFTISVEPGAAYVDEKKTLGALVIGTFIAQTALVPEGLVRQLGRRMNKIDLEAKITETLGTAAQLGVGGPVEVQTMDPATIEGLASTLLGGDTQIPDVVDVVSTTVVEVDAEPAAAVPSADDVPEEDVDFDEFFAGS